MFKNIEKKKLGAMTKMPLTLEEFIRCAIAFVDDADFHTNGRNF